ARPPSRARRTRGARGPSPDRRSPRRQRGSRGPRRPDRPCSSACLPLDPHAGQSRSLPVEPHGELEVAGAERNDVGAGPHGLDRDRLQRPSLERGERFRHFAGRAPELAPGGKPAIDAERGLLAARPVESTKPAGLEPELEQLLQRRSILLTNLALTKRREER